MNVHLSSKKHGNALHAACAQSRANIALIEKLVSRGMEIDARGGKYGTPLQAAWAHSRNDPVIRFLLSQADPCIEVKRKQIWHSAGRRSVPKATIMTRSSNRCLIVARKRKKTGTWRQICMGLSSTQRVIRTTKNRTAFAKRSVPWEKKVLPQIKTSTLMK